MQKWSKTCEQSTARTRKKDTVHTTSLITGALFLAIVETHCMALSDTDARIFPVFYPCIEPVSFTTFSFSLTYLGEENWYGAHCCLWSSTDNFRARLMNQEIRRCHSEHWTINLFLLHLFILRLDWSDVLLVCCPCQSQSELIGKYILAANHYLRTNLFLLITYLTGVDDRLSLPLLPWTVKRHYSQRCPLTSHARMSFVFDGYPIDTTH